MRRVCFAVSVALWVGALAGSVGCCCCQQGFSLRGDWSVQMDALPNECGHRGGCHGMCGAAGPERGELHADRGPTTTPRFHSVPTAPVVDVMTPQAGIADAAFVAAAAGEQADAAKQESSWMFVQGPSASGSPMWDVSKRRQLAADAWTTMRRR